MAPNFGGDFEKLVEGVRSSKIFEAKLGSCGAIVADARFVHCVRDAFRDHLTPPEDFNFVSSTSSLLAFPSVDEIAISDVESCLHIASHYIQVWIHDRCGYAVVDGNVEDSATAEICRSLVWLWLKSGAKLSDGSTLSTVKVDEIIKSISSRGVLLSESTIKATSKIVNSEFFVEWLPIELDSNFLQNRSML
eukprot:TRINITY_DN27743_c0_g1_i2.p1 TRINITY_DN27743_c0_g1~~TRINITY_DN27743_c0_g1_i2.p1  ORF type:complete len:212 (+),score=64.16 TRINITY_DN27743_c0_g1_i2:61-636(+)